MKFFIRNMIVLIIFLVYLSYCHAQGLPADGSALPADFTFPAWVLAVVGLVVSIIDYILSKTTWIPPNSIFESILSILLKILKLIFPDKKQ